MSLPLLSFQFEDRINEADHNKQKCMYMRIITRNYRFFLKYENHLHFMVIKNIHITQNPPECRPSFQQFKCNVFKLFVFVWHDQRRSILFTVASIWKMKIQ